MKTQKKFLIFGLVLFFSLNLHAFELTDQQEKYIQRIWTIKSGLPQNTIQTLLQTHDGYLWIGTPSGLARFDGVRFTIFTKQNTAVLKNDDILALYEDSNKILWIGTDGGGLYSYQNGLWQKYSRKNGISNDHIRSITADWYGNLWIGTDYGLNCLNNEGVKVYTINDGLLDNIITALNIDNSGRVLVGTLRGGLARFDQESIQIFDYKDGLGSPSIYSIHLDSRGNIRIGTFNGIYLFDQEQQLFSEIPETYGIPFTSILEANPMSIWAGTMVAGLIQLEKSDRNSNGKTMSLPDNYIRCMLKDRDGHIWIGTDTEGLIQIKLRKVQAITRDDGLPENGVSTLLEDRLGNLWIGLRNRGLCMISNKGVIKEITDISELSNQGINTLYEDSDGSIWCGTQNNGLFRIKNDISIQLTQQSGLSSNTVTSLLRDHTNILWIGTGKGLCAYQKHDFIQEEKALNDKKINILFEGHENILYTGTDDGLYRRSETGWEKLDPKLSSEVLSLYEDSEGGLWIGTNGNGLTLWKEGQISTLTESQGLFDDYILSISCDEKDNLWMSTYKGVFTVKRTQLLSFIQNRDQFICPTVFDELDGMPSRQCSGNVYPAVWKTRDGKLLYPTVKGVSIFSPNVIESDSLVPGILLEELIIDNQPVKIERSAVQSFSGDRYEFRFTSFDYSSPEKLRFEYMLEGYDENYTRLSSGKERYVIYDNLTAGTYQLLVKVTNREGFQNQKAALINFEIFTPFYAHPIFIMLLIMIVLTISSSLVYLRHQRKVNNQIEKYKTSRLDKEMADKTKEKIKTMMASEKLYLDPDLSLKDLSSRLKIHSNYISRIINEQFKMSYNDYVNMHRVEDVKQKLSDPETNTKTVLEIMYETGFYSKSVFNTAFKKFTGITPSEYRKTHV